MTRTLELFADHDDERLDAFVARRRSELTRSHARKLIADGLVTLNGALAKPSHRLADRKSTRLNSSHIPLSRMPSSA